MRPCWMGSWLIGTFTLGIAWACFLYAMEGIAGTGFSESDAEVFAVVVEDFVSSPDYCKLSAAGEPVFVDATTLPAGHMTSDVQVRAEIKDRDWSSLAPLLVDLRERNSYRLALPWLPPASLGVVVTDLSLLQSEYYRTEKFRGSRCHLRLWLPGHSADGNLSLVRFSWGPTAHGASATYLLNRTKRGWRILWSRISIYA